MDRSFNEKKFYSSLGSSGWRTGLNTSQGTRRGGSRNCNTSMRTTIPSIKFNTTANGFFNNPTGSGIHYSRPINSRGNHYGSLLPL